MKTEQLNRTVDLHEVLKESFGVASSAAWRLIHDGQIQVDGHVVLPQWSRGHWSALQLRGRMLTIPHMSLATRMFQRVP